LHKTAHTFETAKGENSDVTCGRLGGREEKKASKKKFPSIGNGRGSPQKVSSKEKTKSKARGKKTKINGDTRPVLLARKE